MRYSLLLYLLSYLTVSPAQTLVYSSKVDSLKNLISSSAGKIKYQILFDIAYEQFDVDNQEAVEFAEQAYKLSISLGDSLEIIRSGRQYGQLLRRVGYTQEAINLFQIILPISQRNQVMTEYKRILNAISAAYFNMAMYDKALEYNLESLRIREIEGDQKEISTALGNIGLVYYKISDFSHSLDYYQRALSAKEKARDMSGLERLLINISLCYNYMGEYEQALIFVNKGLKICGENCNDVLIVEGEYSIGVCLQNLKDYDLSLFHFNKSYNMAQRIGDKRFEAENVIKMAEIYIEKEDYANALLKLKESKNLSLKSGLNQTLMSTYLTLSELYKRKNNHEQFYLYQSKYNLLKDSVYGQTLINSLSKVQTAYQEEVNKNERLRQEVLSNENTKIVQKTKKQFYLVAGASLLTLIATICFYLILRRNEIKIRNKYFS